MALDSSGTPQIVEEVPFSGRTRWAITGYEADASTAIAIKAAPGAGKSLYITSVVLSATNETTPAWPYLQDEDDNILFAGPMPGDAGTTSIAIVLAQPIKLVSNKALEVKSAAAGAFSLYIEGATAED